MPRVLEIRSNILYSIGYSVGNSTHVEFSKNLSNILYAIEYSYGPTEVSTIYLTFSIAYLIYSTSHLCTNFTATAAFAGRPPKFVLVTQSSRGIDVALLRLDLLDVKCSSLVNKYQGPRT